MNLDDLDLETLFTSPLAFGVTTATNVQRAICRIMDGLPLGDLADDPNVLAAVGGRDAIAMLPIGVRPKEVDILAAIKTGKSQLAACVCLRAARTCDISRLGPGEIARVSLASLTVDLADVVFRHLLGPLTTSPALRPLLMGTPTSDTIMLRHPSGRPVEVCSVAGARAGASFVARWSAGAVFDEKPRMIGSGDGVVNFDDCRDAVLGRLLDGAQIVSIGSPFAPWGPAYNAVRDHFGKPSKHHVVIRSTGPAMNPTWWTPARVAEIKENSPRVYLTDVQGEFLQPESSVYRQEWIDTAEELKPTGLELTERVMLLDLSSGRGDPAAWAIGGWYVEDRWYRRADGTPIIAPWGDRLERKTKGLTPIFVIEEIDQLAGRFAETTSADALYERLANLCIAKNIRIVHADQHEEFSARSAFEKRHLKFFDHTWGSKNKAEAVGLVCVWFRSRRLSLPKDPELHRQLLQYTEKIDRKTGNVRFEGRGQTHDDMAACVTLAALAEIETGLPRSPYRPSWEGSSMGQQPLW